MLVCVMCACVSACVSYVVVCMCALCLSVCARACATRVVCCELCCGLCCGLCCALCVLNYMVCRVLERMCELCVLCIMCAKYDVRMRLPKWSSCSSKIDTTSEGCVKSNPPTHTCRFSAEFVCVERTLDLSGADAVAYMVGVSE